jgi:tetratricopeptide (TPR) repeat protein
MEIADPDVKKSLGLGFEIFLKQVASNAKELNILNWVAETYRGMGESFGTHLRNVPPDAVDAAKSYYSQAAATYQKILDMGAKDPNFLTGPMTTQLQLQLAKTLRSQLLYKEAMDKFEEILKKQPSMLPVQIEAARTSQDWGSFPDSSDNYMRAIVGARPDKAKNGKYTIWGWGEIARMTSPSAQSDQYKDQFHEARFNLALCRYNYAVAQKDAAKKKEAFQRARTDVAIIAGFYPDMGGDKWKAQYDALLKNVQKALGERPLGLPGLKTNQPDTASGK